MWDAYVAIHGMHGERVADMVLNAEGQQAECGVQWALVGQGRRRRGLVAAEGQHLDI